MRSPPAIPFSVYFYLAPEFSILFVYAFRAGKTVVTTTTSIHIHQFRRKYNHNPDPSSYKDYNDYNSGHTQTGHYYLAPIAVLTAFAYLISSLTVFIILHLSYTYYYCYDIDTPIEEITSVCPHASLSVAKVRAYSHFFSFGCIIMRMLIYKCSSFFSNTQLFPNTHTGVHVMGRCMASDCGESHYAGIDRCISSVFLS
jgi:hypothetical protein